MGANHHNNPHTKNTLDFASPLCYTQLNLTTKTTMLPATQTPTEQLNISPESLEVANCYLQLQNIEKTAAALNLSTDIIADHLAKSEVKRYIDLVFFDVGFNNRHTIRSAMDAVLKQKFQDMELAQTGSNKDIADLLALSHKITMDHLQLELQLEKIKLQRETERVRSQVNVQINNQGLLANSKYQDLIQKLIDAPDA